MNKLTDISFFNLALSYMLMLIPLGLMLWLKIPLIKTTLLGIIRMTFQLLFMGFYLQIIFKLDNPYLNAAWLIIMILVADISIVNRAGLKMKYFIFPTALGLFIGTIFPLLVFLYPILRCEKILQAQYAIPIGGMIMGNCLRANIIGIKEFYMSVKNNENIFLSRLAAGATLKEALLPNIKNACITAFSPSIATMSTMGLVSIPGMMTGVIMGGNPPGEAIKYQIAIMIAIFTGTAITSFLVILLTIPKCFSKYGILNKNIFTK